MKALLVADDEKAISNISEVLKAAGYDTIVYKWLLKAMDNVEEIAPHLIVISTKDYPRHWKTLAQYASNITGNYTPEIILYSKEELDEDELKKAEALHVRGIFDSIEVEGLDKLREILVKKQDIFSGYFTEPEQGEINLSDIIPELKNLSKEINSINDILSRPITNEALTQAEEEKVSEPAEEVNSENVSFDRQDNIEENQEILPQETAQENIDSEINEEAFEENTEPEADEETFEEKSETEMNEEVSEDESEPEMSEEVSEEKSEPEMSEAAFEEKSEPEMSEETQEELTQETVEDTAESDIIEGTTEISNESDSDSQTEESTMDEQSLEDKLAAIMNANKAEAKEKAEEVGIDSVSCSFVFTNPVTLAMVSGTARNYNGLTLEFTPDIPSFIMNLDAGTQINCASLKINNEITDVRSEVMSNDSKKLYLQIKK